MVPANVSAFFKVLLPIATYDVVSSDLSTELIFDFDYDAQEVNSAHIKDQMADLGYYTTNSLLCLETIGPMILLYYAKVIVFLGTV